MAKYPFPGHRAKAKLTAAALALALTSAAGCSFGGVPPQPSHTLAQPIPAVDALASKLAQPAESPSPEWKSTLVNDYERVYGPIATAATVWGGNVRRALVCDILNDMKCVAESTQLLDSAGGMASLPIERMAEVVRFNAAEVGLVRRVLQARFRATGIAPNLSPASATAVAAMSDSEQPGVEQPLSIPIRPDLLPYSARQELARPVPATPLEPAISGLSSLAMFLLALAVAAALLFLVKRNQQLVIERLRHEREAERLRADEANRLRGEERARADSALQAQRDQAVSVAAAIAAAEAKVNSERLISDEIKKRASALIHQARAESKVAQDEAAARMRAEEAARRHAEELVARARAEAEEASRKASDLASASRKEIEEATRIANAKAAESKARADEATRRAEEAALQSQTQTEAALKAAQAAETAAKLAQEAALSGTTAAKEAMRKALAQKELAEKDAEAVRESSALKLAAAEEQLKAALRESESNRELLAQARQLQLEEDERVQLARRRAEAEAARMRADPSFDAARTLLDSLDRAEHDVEPFFQFIGASGIASGQHHRQVVEEWHRHVRAVRNNLAEALQRANMQIDLPVFEEPATLSEAMMRLVDHAAFLNALLSEQAIGEPALANLSRQLPGAVISLFWGPQSENYTSLIKTMPLPMLARPAAPTMPTPPQKHATSAESQAFHSKMIKRAIENETRKHAKD